MAAETAAEWDQAAQAGATVDACTDMMRATLRAAAETLFGDDLGARAAGINRVFPTGHPTLPNFACGLPLQSR